MNNRMRVLLALGIGLITLPAGTAAHFRLLEPPSWIEMNNLGDPQKVGPCGGDPKGANEKLLTNVVTKVTGGSKLHLKIQETIFHSGHYRIALAVNSRTEAASGSVGQGEVDREGALFSVGPDPEPPQVPVLADGLFQHYPKPGEPGSAMPKTPMAPWETDIELPNITCAKCTLQVIQFMADHVSNQPGGYAYHHCADLQITANTAKPIDKRWPAATAGN